MSARTSFITGSKSFQAGLGKDVGKAPCLGTAAIRKDSGCKGGLAVAAGAPVLRTKDGVTKLVRIGDGFCNRCKTVMKKKGKTVEVPKLDKAKDPRVARQAAEKARKTAEAAAAS